MFVSCWSAKGGSGTTVIACGMALRAASQSPTGALLVDLAGDAPAVLGQPDPTGPGIGDWLAAGEAVPADGLARLEVPITDRLALLPRGPLPLSGSDRAIVLASLLANESREVIADCGCLGEDRGPATDVGRAIASAATRSLLVTRACYVSLRRAGSLSLSPSEVVLLQEPGRSLDAVDVAEVLGARVACVVPVDPSIARAVDAGLLAARVPRRLERALAGPSVA